ncbi:helix-turn-helix transcriptional regulator [uncultured Fenollaria sp.]|uniref:ArsR/SmtB family transcription factor n=1 Tax=uncultured Fenollaria sp. TaxID=1686315 RepID=UPI0025D067D2|nr:metalloregulator ArsR/SmtB family transcription factor [uncultured Fenollaria sp.]
MENRELSQEDLDAIKNDVIDYKIVEKLADIMKALSEPSRIQIIHALSLSDMCVTDLSYALNMTQPLVSHHLRILRNLGLVKYERDGKALIYSLDDEHVLMLYKQGLEHAKEKVQ